VLVINPIEPIVLGMEDRSLSAELVGSGRERALTTEVALSKEVLNVGMRELEMLSNDVLRGAVMDVT